MNAWGWWTMALMMLICLAVVGVGVWVILRFTASSNPPSTVLATSARALLDGRFARGEIDAEVYANARRLLDSNEAGTGV